MSLYKKIGYGYGNTNPIVMDIGESYTKLGFAGESSPRTVIPTAIQQIGGPITYIFKSDHSSIVKHHYDGSLKKSIVKFFEKIFYKELQISPKNQQIIICESLLNPTKIREQVAEVLFQFFEVAALVFAPQHLLSCFTVATGTALVVDCSYGETLVLPVVDGTPLVWAWQSAPLGGAAVHEELQNGIITFGKLHVNNLPPEKLSVKLSERVLEDIKVKACFVTEYERAKKIHHGKLKDFLQNKDKSTSNDSDLPRLPEMVYPLDGVTKLIIPGELREGATEVLFDQDNDRTSVPTLVLDALCHCPLVARKSLAASLLVTGGTSMLPGFRHRLLFELKELISKEERYKKLSELELKVHNPPVPANLVSWLGASIFSSLEVFKRRLITKEYYEQHNGKLPDWCGPMFPEKNFDSPPQPAKLYKPHLSSVRPK